ncbi:MAG: sigma-70 family RNA polymerase sigma factor [Candidatus Desulforudis sp.]|nr:sigma-70 family RNA polymerase sigma factor [Desulforudis sp.]
MQLEIRGAERLSFRERQVVALKEMGYANGEVAKRLGLSPSTVATLFNRARAKGYQVVLVMTGDPLGIFVNEEGEQFADGVTEKT